MTICHGSSSATKRQTSSVPSATQPIDRPPHHGGAHTLKRFSALSSPPVKMPRPPSASQHTQRALPSCASGTECTGRLLRMSHTLNVPS